MDELDPTIKKFQKEIISGIASMVLLSVVAQSKGPIYGYQVIKNLEHSKNQIPLPKLGALYPVLRSLEKGELLMSEVEPSFAGPPRRYYSITSKGKSTLEEWKKIWGETRDYVDTILAGSARK
jgi:PadR family transcriptional regulator, regulatory protein PadR